MIVNYLQKSQKLPHFVKDKESLKRTAKMYSSCIERALQSIEAVFTKNTSRVLNSVQKQAVVVRSF